MKRNRTEADDSWHWTQFSRRFIYWFIGRMWRCTKICRSNAQSMVCKWMNGERKVICPLEGQITHTRIRCIGVYCVPLPVVNYCPFIRSELCVCVSEFTLFARNENNDQRRRCATFVSAASWIASIQIIQSWPHTKSISFHKCVNVLVVANDVAVVWCNKIIILAHPIDAQVDFNWKRSPGGGGGATGNLFVYRRDTGP